MSEKCPIKLLPLTDGALQEHQYLKTYRVITVHTLKQFTPTHFSRHSPLAILFFLDLYPLIDYLQISPYSELSTWKYILYDPYVQGNYEPMYKFLSQVMWRSAKNNVVDQVFFLKFLGDFFLFKGCFRLTFLNKPCKSIL